MLSRFQPDPNNCLRLFKIEIHFFFRRKFDIRTFVLVLVFESLCLYFREVFFLLVLLKQWNTNFCFQTNYATLNYWKLTGKVPVKNIILSRIQLIIHQTLLGSPKSLLLIHYSPLECLAYVKNYLYFYLLLTQFQSFFWIVNCT